MIKYGPEEAPINLVADASLTGAGGALSQGHDLKTARIIVFWSGKFNSAQQNYPVHEREMLAIVESLKRFRYLLQGVKFRVFTDHKPLLYLKTQQHFSARQHRWMDVLSDFDFDLHYIPGEANTMADSLSRIYSADTLGTVRATSEFVSEDKDEPKIKTTGPAIYTGTEAEVFTYAIQPSDRVTRSSSNRLPRPKDRTTYTDLAVLPLTEKARDQAIKRATKTKPKKFRPQVVEIITQDLSDSEKSSRKGGEEQEADNPRWQANLAPHSEQVAVQPTSTYGSSPPKLDTPLPQSTSPFSNQPRNTLQSAIAAQKRIPQTEDSSRLKPPARVTWSENSPAHSLSRLPLAASREQPPLDMLDPEQRNSYVSGGAYALLNNQINEKAILNKENAPTSGVKRTLSDPESPTPSVPLTSIVKMATPDLDFPKCLEYTYGDDPFFKDIFAQPDHYRNFVSSDGLLFLNDNHRRLLCIPNLRINKNNIREYLISQAHSLLAHLGSRKTSLFLRDNYWWPNLHKDVTFYCTSCTICATTKTSTQRPYGLLRPLTVPTRPWQSIGIDFVGPLPLSQTRSGDFDQITVIVDHLTSMTHLVPSETTYRAKEVAELVFDSVYKLHGLPEHIVSDRDSLFTSLFWSQLHKLIGTNLKMSTAYHPETDGFTERTNRTIMQMLRHCVDIDQKNWAIKIPLIEFALNSARSDTTGFSPFFLNSGREPGTMIWNTNLERYNGVRVFAQRMKEALMQAHDAILAARIKQTHLANRHRRPAPFSKGDYVYLSTKNITLPKGLARKLSPKYIGPFLIIEEVTRGLTFRLDLSNDLKRRGIHPVFHASLLRIHNSNDDRRFPGRSWSQMTGLGNSPSEWPVSKITTHIGRARDAHFLVQWKAGDSSWLPFSSIQHLEPLNDYLDAVGVKTIDSLSTPPTHQVTSSETTNILVSDL